jgi:hypothetical protein
MGSLIFLSSSSLLLAGLGLGLAGYVSANSEEPTEASPGGGGTEELNIDMPVSVALSQRSPSGI